jgi:predicted Zn-dependent protease
MQARPAENGTGKTESPVVYDSWVSLLFAVQEGESAKLPELKIVEDASGQNADIKIFFEGQPHPQGKGLGVTTSMYDGQTLEIVSAEIHIYRSHELYQENILGAVLRHEIGHALGIGHSTSMASIMYSRIVIVDDRVIGAIGECESGAVEMAYVQNKIKDVSCMEASSTGN